MRIKMRSPNIFNVEKYLNDRNVSYIRSGNSYQFYMNDQTAGLWNTPIVFDEPKTITVSGSIETSSTNGRIEFFDENDNLVGQLWGSNEWGALSYPNLTDGHITVPNVKKFRIKPSYYGYLTLNSIQIEEGTKASPYMPYNVNIVRLVQKTFDGSRTISSIKQKTNNGIKIIL